MFKKTLPYVVFCLFSVFTAELTLRLYGWSEKPRLYKEVNDSDIRWVHTSGFKGNLFETDIEINSQGLRDRELSIEKSKDTFRIVAVGECTVFGRGVTLENSFLRNLENQLNLSKPFKNFKRYEVVNLGLVQYTDFQKTSLLTFLGLKYQPDLIIFGHDLGPKVWVEPRSKLRWFSLFRDNIPRQILSLHFLISEIENYILLPIVKKITPSRSEDAIPLRYNEAGLKTTKTAEAFVRLGLLKRNSSIPILVVFMPWLNDLAENKYKYFWIHKIFETESHKNNLAFLDLYAAYFKNKKPETFWLSNDNRRPNALAYDAIAKKTYHALLQIAPADWKKTGP